MGNRAQPSHQRLVDAGAHALEDALEQVVMRGYQPRIDDAARGVDGPLAGIRGEVADRGNAPVADADCPSGAHRVAGQAGENPVCVADQQRGHAWLRFRWAS